MKELTDKEEEMMRIFWQNGPMFVRDIQKLYDDPKPHINTLSTFVRCLEAKGYLTHKAYGNCYMYMPLVKVEDYRKKTLKNFIKAFFNNSYMSVVSTLVEDEDISAEELKELLDEVNKNNDLKQ